MSFRAWGSSSRQNKFSHASYIGTGNKYISRGDDLKKKYRKGWGYLGIDGLQLKGDAFFSLIYQCSKFASDAGLIEELLKNCKMPLENGVTFWPCAFFQNTLLRIYKTLSI